MGTECERADLGVWLQWITDADAPATRDEALDERVCDASLQEDPRSGEALLAVVAVDPREGAVQGAPDIGRVEDDVGGFATEFERDGFQVAPGGGGDHAPGGGAAGEPHHVDSGMRHQGVPGHCAAAVHEIDHACRQSGFVQHFDHSPYRKRGEFGGFEHTGVAPGDTRGDAH